MHTWRDLFDEQDTIFEAQYNAKEIQFDYDKKSKINHNTVFFLYSFQQILAAYLYGDFSGVETHHDQHIANITKYSNMENVDDYGRPCPLVLSDVWRFIDLEDLEKKSAFNVSIIENQKFFIFYFNILTRVAFEVEPQRMMQNINAHNREIDIPISYDYFSKIICNKDIGAWRFLTINGKVKEVLPPIRVDEITEIDKNYIYHSDISKDEHKEKLSRKITQVANQKANLKIANLHYEGMGYPYENTYDEYIRFLKTNLKYMKFRDFKIMMNQLFDLFIPSALS